MDKPKPKAKFKVGDRVITNGSPSDWGRYLKMYNDVQRSFRLAGRTGTVVGVQRDPRFYYYKVQLDERFFYEGAHRRNYYYSARQIDFYRRKDLKDIVDYWDGHPVMLRIIQLDESNFGWEANGSLVLHGFCSFALASEALSDRIQPPTSEIY